MQRTVRRHGARNFPTRALFTIGSICLSMLAAAQYSQHNLVSNGFVSADHVDPQLKNPWGIAFSSTSYFWVADDQSNASTLYDGNGVKQSLVVNTSAAFPAGAVFNPGPDFVISNGTSSGPSSFIFAHEGGQISAWKSSITGTSSVTVADRSAQHADYTGLAIQTGSNGSRIYASNFIRGNGVDMFDGSFNYLGSFTDPTISDFYGPFNVQSIGTSVYVMYAWMGINGDAVFGSGLGYVDEFDFDGHLLRRVVSNGALNAPWAVAMAPAGYGQFGGDLLVANFGDGTINAFNPTTGVLMGTIRDSNGLPIVNDKPWGMAFGNGAHGFDQNSLYLASAGYSQVDGLFSRIDAVPEPATLSAIGLGLLAILRRRRKR